MPSLRRGRTMPYIPRSTAIAHPATPTIPPATNAHAIESTTACHTRKAGIFKSRDASPTRANPNPAAKARASEERPDATQARQSRRPKRPSPTPREKNGSSRNATKEADVPPCRRTSIKDRRHTRTAPCALTSDRQRIRAAHRSPARWWQFRSQWPRKTRQ